MPRKRHDSSSEDSDSSKEEVRRDKVKPRSQQGTDRRSQPSESASPQKRSKGNQNARKRMDSEHESSTNSMANRSRDHPQSSSDSDSSPVKRSVVSKVEKANVVPGRDRDDQEFDGRNRGRRDDMRDQHGSNIGRSNWRVESPSRMGRMNERSNEMSGGRMLSPNRRPRRGTMSPDRVRLDPRLAQRREMPRSLSGDRNDVRNDGRRSLSPDRNQRFNAHRNDNQNRGQRSRSPVRGQVWRDQSIRERFENDNRDQGYRSNQQPRYFDNSRMQNRGQDWVFPDRNRQNRGRSPVRIDEETYDRRDQGRLNRDGRQRSVSPIRSNRDERLQRSVSPVRSSKGHRSVSPIRTNRGHRSVSPIQEGFSGKKTADRLSVKSKSKSEKVKKTKDSKIVERSTEDSENADRTSDVSKKSKSKKKKKTSEKDDSLERSFERSKQLLEESAHSNDFDIPEPEKPSQELTPLKVQKKSKTKRQRQYSESEQDLLPKKTKKSKGSLELNKMSDKKLQKKSKKSLSHSRSRSPSPSERSSDKIRSRSAERSFGRGHDIAQFESEPESGEITDSEEDSEQAKALKSLINKPTGEESQQNMADERYLNQKRKASRMKEREESEKDVQGKKEQKIDRGSKRKLEETKGPTPEPTPVSKKPKPADAGVAALTGRTGGAYIPPARLRAMQAKITDKSSVEFQRISWEALKKSINGLVNKVNVGNIENIVRELFQENIVRGRGLMARSIIQAQAASPTFTHVYAALVAIVNTKFPQNGELILRRVVIQFRRGYKRNDKSMCLSSTRFVAHLVNQQVAHEVLALEVLTLLLETPTDDSVEVAIGFLKECGQKLTEVTPRGINAIFERLRNVLHEGQTDIRVQYMMEVMFAVRKDHFKDFPAIVEDLDLVEEEDQFTHLLTLEDAANGEDILNVFKADSDFEENEEKYKILKKEILGESTSDDEDASRSGSGSDSEDGDTDEEDEEAKQKIIDQTETNMVALRRAIYLTIQSSLDFEECAHKLMKMELKPGQEVELCSMILDCCAQMRTYEKFFGLLAGRFCMIDRKYVAPFQLMFKEQYNTIHRLETNKLRNVAKFFAHLLHTDSLSWAVLLAIRLNEDDTTSASRIFIKILFQELSEYLGLAKLNDRLKDPTLQEYYAGLLPRDNPRDTRFAINFFTTIGLGGLTDDLRDHLKDVSKRLMQQKQEEQAQAMQAEHSGVDSDDSSEDSDSSDDSESSASASESESSDDNRKKKNKDRKTKVDKEKDKRAKENGRKDKEKISDKDNRKNKDKTNSSFEKRGRNDVEKVGKKDKKKNRKMEDILKRQRKTEEVIRREQEEQFKKLAKLANYGNIDELNPSFGEDRRKGKKDKKEKKNRRGKKVSDNEDYDDHAEGQRFIDYKKKTAVELDEFDARAYADKSFERGFEGRGDRDDRGGGRYERGGRDDRGGRDERGGQDDRGGAGDRRQRRAMGGAPREDRGTFNERGNDKEGRHREKGHNKKGRNFIEDDLDDVNIRVERNFERMDLYEEKFERDRERNLEQLRGREEYQDYYRATRVGEDVLHGGSFRGREMPYKGGRERDDMVDRLEYEGRVGDRCQDDERRGRNRSEEEVLMSDRHERRRRR